MTPPFKNSNSAVMPNLPLADVCPRAGVLNPIAYNCLTADGSLVEAGINPGDDVYILSTADIESGDLVAMKTPDGLFVRFVEWYTDSSGGAMVRLLAANPEVKTTLYDYDDEHVRTRWRAVWQCQHEDHSSCKAITREGRRIC